MKKILLVCALALPLAACGEERAEKAVQALGFKNVQLGGTPWFGCSENDSAFYSKKFTATAVNGESVSGVVCGAALKGWTVRLD